MTKKWETETSRGNREDEGPIIISLKETSEEESDLDV